MIQTWIIYQKPWIWANLGPICQNLGQIFSWYMGFVTFFHLLKTSFMQKIKEILWTVPKKNSGHTNVWRKSWPRRTDERLWIYRTNLQSRWRWVQQNGTNKFFEDWNPSGPFMSPLAQIWTATFFFNLFKYLSAGIHMPGLLYPFHRVGYALSWPIFKNTVQDILLTLGSLGSLTLDHGKKCMAFETFNKPVHFRKMVLEERNHDQFS